MAAIRKRLGDLLVSLHIVTQEQVEKAVAFQKDNPTPFGTVLVSMGFITEDLLLNVLAAQIGVSPWRIDQDPPEAAAVTKVPAHLCRTHQCLPVAVRGDLMMVAMVNPHNFGAIEAIRAATGMRIEPVLADAQRLVKAIETAHGGTEAKEDLDELVDQALKDLRNEGKVQDKSAQITEADSRPVVDLVNQMLSNAIRKGASDVHIEPRADRVDVRYRVDGQLQLAQQIPPSLLPMLTTRLKIMAELDIVEFRIPQDGRVSVKIDGRHVDLRVSVIPNYHGQRIVLRILDKTSSLKKLDQIGFSGDNLTIFRNMVSKPYGMFLVTGPTGSGKTTTLYAALQELSGITNNVMTCEDPVEYDIDGVNQSQVHEKVGLTFARQLRAILRQDPDVILVGEIRDSETAETAMRAALTGHMVLSTLHCNDAPSAIPRLLDMGADPLLLSTSLVGMMSQRLLRQLCTACRKAESPTTEDKELFASFDMAVPVQLYRAVGCVGCSQSGYRGRRAIHEIMAVTPSVGKVIACRGPLEDLCSAAAVQGYEPMAVRALEMVAAGETTMSEAKRIVFMDAAYAEASLSSDDVQLRLAS